MNSIMSAVGVGLGLRESKVEGYSYNFFIWKSDDNVISVPIEIINKDTLIVYER